MKPTTIIQIVVILMALSAPFFALKWRDAEGRETMVSQYAIAKDKEIEYYRNSLNEQVAKTDAVLLETKSLKKLAEDNSLKWLKEFEGVKKNLRNVEVATNLNTQTIAEFTATGTDTTILIDSVETPAFTFVNKNEWIDESGTVIPSLKKVDTKIKVTVPIEAVLYWERKKVIGLRIGRKQYKVEVKSKNPYTTILQADQLLISH